MNSEKPLNKKRLEEALSRFDPIIKDHGLGTSDLYMLTIPQSIVRSALVIFRDQVPEDDDTRTIRDAMGRLTYTFEEDQV